MAFVPSPMTHTSARLLEFETLRELLAGYSSSLPGKRKIADLSPSLDRAWIETQHQLTAEIREFRRGGGRFEFSGLPEVAKLLERSRIEGAAFETTEIRDIVLLVDRASPELTRIRREIEKQKRLIQESLRGYLRRLAEGGTVQDELITIRGERFVIPVKVEQKRRVQGVVHGASSSGQTVFVEPLETIDQNNELVRLLDEELAEIHRILLEMTRRIGESADPILKAADVLAELELQFAKARFAEDYNCVPVSLLEQDSDDHISPRGDSRPRLPEPGSARLVLHNTRHPLLERNLKTKKRPLVPIRIELESGNLELVITGPNTGGKTVALKTVGLLALMAQSGIPVPADRAELPV